MAEIERISSQNEIAIQKEQMENEKALLELIERYQTKNEELINDYNAKVDEYNKKIKSLLDEIQGHPTNTRTDKKDATATKKNK